MFVPTEGKSLVRDAVHIAIAPFKVGPSIEAGDHVYINDNGELRYTGADDVNCIGVVDPFIDGHIRQGDWVYVFMKPGTCQNLRHAWDHPALDHQMGDLGDLLAMAHSQAEEKLQAQIELEKRQRQAGEDGDDSCSGC